MAALIRLDGVAKRFVLHHHRARSFQDLLVNLVHRRNGSSEEFWALRDVSFEVRPGETLGIIGENGSGKSTLLKLITRILEPTRGRVVVNGKVSALIELGAGFHPDLTGRENIYLNGSIMGFSRKEMDRRFPDIVAFAELERFIDTPVKHYSSGMYARLGFSVAISVDPDVLIVDEVLSVGDEVFQHKCLDRIADFRRHGKTILFVSHDLATVELLCDRVLWLNAGALQADGPAATTVRQYLAELRRHEERNRAREQDAGGGDSAGTSDVHRSAEDSLVFDARLLSPAGTERSSFQTGQGLIARFWHRAVDPDRDHVVDIEIRRDDGLLVYRSSRRFEARGALPPGDVGLLEIKIDSLPLLAGNYEITGNLRPADEAADLGIERLVSRQFSVWSDGADDGIVAIPISLVHDGSSPRSASPASEASVGAR